jgi:hypothetical protein
MVDGEFTEGGYEEGHPVKHVPIKPMTHTDVGAIVLWWAGAIHGRITPATPEQLAAMVVSVEGTDFRGSKRWIVSARPDPYGYYLLTNVPTGERQVILKGIWFDPQGREMLVQVKRGVVIQRQDFVLNPPIAAQPRPQVPDVTEQAPVVPDERPPLLRTDEPLLEVGVEVGVNRPGSDYRSFEMRQADAKLCQQACTEDQQCRAWTYVKPGVQGNTARCWLKNAVPNPQPDDCCTSGVKGL